MSLNRVSIFLLLFSLAIANARLCQANASPFAKGSVACLDCPQGYDLSGLQVLVKCDNVKKLAMTYTDKFGIFVVELPFDAKPGSTHQTNCMTKIMGGPHRLYVSVNDSLVSIQKSTSSGQHYMRVSKPLEFYKECPMKGKCNGINRGFETPKTKDKLGSSSSSYYIPYEPIMGIP